jgi:hypothetical protein
LAFKLQKIEQEELKTVTLRYTRTQAVQQSYLPQGFVSLLAADIGPGHFFDIDLDDPFFRTIDIVAEFPLDFDRLGLLSVQAALDYGRLSDPAGVKHKDFTFDKSSARQQAHSFSMNPRLDTSYQLNVQYHFDPLSGWDGEKFDYDLPAQQTEDRTLLLNPFADLGFLELSVIPGSIDWGIVQSVDVHLRYEDPGVFTRQKTITFTEGMAEQLWRLRLTHPEQREITFSTVNHLSDGSTRESAPITTQASSIVVDDAFQAALDVEFVPIYDTSRIRTVFAEIHYEDLANLYERDERLTFEGTTPGSQKLHLALLNPAITTYTISYTLLGNDNSIQRLPPEDSTKTLVFVGETF